MTDTISLYSPAGRFPGGNKNADLTVYKIHSVSPSRLVFSSSDPEVKEALKAASTVVAQDGTHAKILKFEAYDDSDVKGPFSSPLLSDGTNILELNLTVYILSLTYQVEGVEYYTLHY